MKLHRQSIWLLIALALANFSSVNADENKIACVQAHLNILGHKAGPADGQIGRKTRSAATTYLEASGASLPAFASENAGIWCEDLKKQRRLLRIEQMKSAFEQWATENNVFNASLAITIDGMIVEAADRGSYAPSRAAPVASLTKAITGVCIAKLVENGAIEFRTKIETVLSSYFKDSSSANSRVGKITVAQLLTHTSGITNDPSQGAALNQFRPFSVSSDRQLVVALRSQVNAARYSYNNMNYVALGEIIEATTGETYEAYCGREVLESIGVRGAKLNPDWRVMGAYGGWMLSATDYARFLVYFDPIRTPLSTKPTDWPYVKLRGGARYGLGTLYRRAGSAHNFWHVGSWRRNSPYASFGAFFALWRGTAGVVVNYSPTVSDNVVNALDKALYKAALR